MKIEYSRGHVDIERNGRKARFFGDLGLVGFRAFANTMKWISPKSDEQISPEERNEWMKAVNNHFANIKDRVFFVDDKGNEIKLD